MPTDARAYFLAKYTIMCGTFQLLQGSEKKSEMFEFPLSLFDSVAEDKRHNTEAAL